MQTTITVTDPREVIDPDTLGEGGAPTHFRESKFVGFQCLCCGARHVDLADLMNCHENKRIAPVVDMSVFPVAA